MSASRAAVVGLVAAAFAAVCGAGCARTTAPPGFLSVPEESQRTAWGGWIELELEAGVADVEVPLATEFGAPDSTGRDRRWQRGVREGELIAVGMDSAYVLTYRGFDAVALAGVAKARLTGYDAETGRPTLWVVAGSLSTASHGFGALISLPVWAIAGGLMVGSHSREPMMDAPERSWADMRMYARFPQGLPPGLARAKLKPKPLTPPFTPR